MSYEQWCDDAKRLSQAIPEGTPVGNTVHNLLTDIAPFGVEVLPEAVSYQYLDRPRDDPEFPVINIEQIKPESQYLLSRYAGQTMLAFVVPGRARSALALPSHNPESPIGNGLLLTHELRHMTQDFSHTYQYRVETGEPEPDLTLEQFRQCQQSSGALERDAYGLNVSTLRAIDGDDFDDYLTKWDALTRIEGQPGREHGAIQFLEKRFSFEPSAKRVWYPWESENFSRKLINKVADLPIFAKSLPKPDKGTYTYELWREGQFSRNVLRSIGQIAVLERELGDKVPTAHLDELAGAIFGSHSKPVK